ncbi:MAG: hypothetical protein IPM97_12550 [Bdellovibrionaceae bacterium]|nr:hypothetical protein [Pseudobdellovibrionaceae bacterium]
MKSYLLLTEGRLAEWKNLTESRRNEIVAKFGDYAKKLGSQGFLRGGEHVELVPCGLS